MQIARSAPIRQPFYTTPNRFSANPEPDRFVSGEPLLGLIPRPVASGPSNMLSPDQVDEVFAREGPIGFNQAEIRQASNAPGLPAASKQWLQREQMEAAPASPGEQPNALEKSWTYVKEKVQEGVTKTVSLCAKAGKCLAELVKKFPQLRSKLGVVTELFSAMGSAVTALGAASSAQELVTAVSKFANSMTKLSITTQMGGLGKVLKAVGVKALPVVGTGLAVRDGMAAAEKSNEARSRGDAMGEGLWTVVGVCNTVMGVIGALRDVSMVAIPFTGGASGVVSAGFEAAVGLVGAGCEICASCIEP